MANRDDSAFAADLAPKSWLRMEVESKCDEADWRLKGGWRPSERPKGEALKKALAEKRDASSLLKDLENLEAAARAGTGAKETLEAATFNSRISRSARVKEQARKVSEEFHRLRTTNPAWTLARICGKLRDNGVTRLKNRRIQQLLKIAKEAASKKSAQ